MRTRCKNNKINRGLWLADCNPIYKTVSKDFASAAFLWTSTIPKHKVERGKCYLSIACGLLRVTYETRKHRVHPILNLRGHNVLVLPSCVALWCDFVVDFVNYLAPVSDSHSFNSWKFAKGTEFVCGGLSVHTLIKPLLVSIYTKCSPSEKSLSLNSNFEMYLDEIQIPHYDSIRRLLFELTFGIELASARVYSLQYVVKIVTVVYCKGMLSNLCISEYTYDLPSSFYNFEQRTF